MTVQLISISLLSRPKKRNDSTYRKASFSLFLSVIGVALMVGILFFLMIAVEQTFEWLGNQMSKIFGSKKSEDAEDPAALVGSFKRYKN